MHGNLSVSGDDASKSDDRNVCEPGTYDTSVCDDGEWFPRAARILLAPKPGLVLHLLTDCGERNGDRYASGDVKVPSYIVRQLLRGEHGEAWLNAIMEGARPPWWIEHQRALDIGRKVLALVK